MKLNVRYGVCVLLVSVLLLGGVICPARSEAAVKDSLTVAVASEWVTLDPALGNDLAVFAMMEQIFDTLVRQEKSGAYVPGLATEWKISEDGKEYTFSLRENVKFHNGDIMTADDVVFSLDRAVASPATSRVSGTIAKTEKIDDHTVKITLKFPYGPFIGCLSAANLGVVSKRAVEEMGDAFARTPVGTGPFKFVQWVPGDRILLESFPDYFRGEAAIKSVTYRIIPDPTTQVIALEQGEIDMISTVTPSEIPNVINNDKFFYDETPQARYLFIGFNNEVGLFKNKLLRQAVSYAIDREAVLLGGAEGAGAILETPIPASCFGYPADFKSNPYDPEKAMALLKEGGYNNEVLQLKCIAKDARAAEVVQEQMRQVGFNVEFDLMEGGAWLADVQTATNYEITVTVMSALVPDADLITYIRFHSSMVGNGANFTRCSLPEMDEALDIGRTSMDPEERKAAYVKVSEIVRDEAVLVPIFSGMSSIACDVRLKGVKANPLSGQYLYDLYWEE